MKYYCDGYTLDWNPSKKGGGYSIVDEHGSIIEHKVINKEGFTNNEAEILGILGTLELCKEGDSVSTDSMVAISWIRKGSSKARPEFNGILLKCKELIIEKKINLMWEGREFNLAGHFNEDYDTAAKKFQKIKANKKLRKIREESQKNHFGMKDFKSSLDKFQELLKGVKTYVPTTLFDLSLDWEKLQEKRCPICGTKLTFPQKVEIALCRGKRHPDKRPFIIKLETLEKVIHR